MKKTLCILTFCAMLLAGCSQAAQPQVQPTEPPQTQPQQTEPSQSLPPEGELLANAAQWLNKDCCFIFTYQFYNPGVFGMAQRTEQIYCEDGSMLMVTARQTQRQGSQEIQEEMGVFYYVYEGDQYVCYSRIDDQKPQRGVVTEQVLKEMEASEALLVGIPCLLPNYLQGLGVAELMEEEGITVFSYWLPLDAVMEDSTILSVFVNNAFSFAGKTYPEDADARILVMLQVNTETCQPLAATCFFNEVIPYLLPESALTDEVLQDQSLMTVDYRFNYELTGTVQVPEDMIP